MQYTQRLLVTVKDVVFGLKSAVFDAILNAARCFGSLKSYQGGISLDASRGKGRGEKLRTCLEGSSTESPDTAMTFFSPSLRLPVASLPSQVPKIAGLLV